MRKEDWIKVEDSLPDDNETVLIFTPVDGWGTARRSWEKDSKGYDECTWRLVNKSSPLSPPIYDVTHWMRIVIP